MKGKKNRKDSGYVHRIGLYFLSLLGHERGCIRRGRGRFPPALKVAKQNAKAWNVVRSELICGK